MVRAVLRFARRAFERWLLRAVGVAIAVTALGIGLHISPHQNGKVEVPGLRSLIQGLTNSSPGAPSPQPGLGPAVRATIVRVHDGDTITVMLADGTKTSVRVVGVDTPEIPPKPPECGGAAAAEAAKKAMPKGATVWLRVDPAAGDLDAYKRELRVVYVTPSRTWQATLLRDGLADVYDFHKQKFVLLDRWRKLRDEARAAKRGTWGACPAALADAKDTDGWSTGPAS